MDSSNASNYNSIQVLFSKHLVIIFMNMDTFELILCPLTLVLVGAADSYYYSTRGKRVKIQSMSLSWPSLAV